jgi:gliding motility-associated lipoprotein GldD
MNHIQFVFKTIFFIISLLILNSCTDDIQPKPKAYLYLEYTQPEYQRFINGCPFSFAISQESNIAFKDDCSATIFYPKLKAQIHLTYKTVNNNLSEILTDADKLTSKHTVKADAILPFPFENKTNKVFGILNEVQGESASNIQFHITDSIHHVITAALYFKVKPNYDSLYPAIDYIKNDMMNMMETVEWK